MMLLAVAARGDQLGAALVRAHHLHQGRLAHDRQRRLDARAFRSSSKPVTPTQPTSSS